ncbi:hypothetical protein B0H16DRAFT_1801434 [Mycena metata]|uniref:Uncharacterized protein n=1 Tax=Mycena metata TaxID=1033252 RepID=A0AAD7MGY4_9AGAR|nr:hypothetical protein B0H16DRAFT_1801434 [Mycena metata]
MAQKKLTFRNSAYTRAYPPAPAALPTKSLHGLNLRQCTSSARHVFSHRTLEIMGASYPRGMCEAGRPRVGARRNNNKESGRGGGREVWWLRMETRQRAAGKGKDTATTILKCSRSSISSSASDNAVRRRSGYRRRAEEGGGTREEGRGRGKKWEGGIKGGGKHEGMETRTRFCPMQYHFHRYLFTECGAGWDGTGRRKRTRRAWVADNGWRVARECRRVARGSGAAGRAKRRAGGIGLGALDIAGHVVERSGGRRWGGTGRARRAGRGVGRGWKEEAVEWRRRAERIRREQEEGAGGRKRAVAGGGRVMVAGQPKGQRD